MNVLLKNGTITDGSGGAPYAGSVIIKDDVISDVVKGEPVGDFAEVIDCKGLVISPGFIDAHSHNDWYAARKDPVPYFKPFAEQGITSQVAGNCGFSLFGYKPDTEYKSIIGGGLFETEDKSADFSSFTVWRESASKTAPLNIIPMQGHASLRTSISGYENRALTAEETALKNAKIEESLRQGAFGLSFGLMYEPDRYALPDELEEAAKVAAKQGGMLTVHARAFSKVSTSYNPPVGGEAHNIRALKEMIDLARRTGVRLQYSHLIFVGKSTWSTVEQALELIDSARSHGVDIAFDLYSMTFGVSVITVVLPSWYLSMPKEKRHSPIIRARLALEIGVTKKLLGFNFSDMEIAWIGDGSESICGKRVNDIAKEWKTSDLEAYIRLVEASDATGRVNLYRYYDDATIERLMKHEASLFMTDAWIEEYGVQNASAYSCFPKFLALSREKNILSLQETVRKMSGAVADRFGIQGRGYLKRGCAADVTVFDPTTVGAMDDPLKRPAGVCHVFVNGIHIVKDGIADETLLKGAGTIISKQ